MSEATCHLIRINENLPSVAFSRIFKNTTFLNGDDSYTKEIIWNAIYSFKKTLSKKMTCFVYQFLMVTLSFDWFFVLLYKQFYSILFSNKIERDGFFDRKLKSCFKISYIRPHFRGNRKTSCRCWRQARAHKSKKR
jgi:hypothetical protein